MIGREEQQRDGDANMWLAFFGAFIFPYSFH